MAEEKKRLDLDREFQEKRKTEHLADPDKNKAAWQHWTKPRRPTLKDGEV